MEKIEYKSLSCKVNLTHLAEYSKSPGIGVLPDCFNWLLYLQSIRSHPSALTYKNEYLIKKKMIPELLAKRLNGNYDFLFVPPSSFSFANEIAMGISKKLKITNNYINAIGKKNDDIKAGNISIQISDLIANFYFIKNTHALFDSASILIVDDVISTKKTITALLYFLLNGIQIKQVSIHIAAALLIEQ